MVVKMCVKYTVMEHLKTEDFVRVDTIIVLRLIVLEFYYLVFK